MKKLLFAYTLSLGVIAAPLYAQLNVAPTANPTTLVNAIVGQGVQVSNISFNCQPGGAGTFSNGNNSNLGLSGGIILSNGLAANAAGPNNQQELGNNHGASFSDPNLTAIEPLATLDPCILEFDIVPTCDTLSLNYVFGSEEYMTYVNSGYNDAFGFFITGPNPQGGTYNAYNIARLPNGTTPVTIDNVNLFSNAGYYTDNGDGFCFIFPPATCTNSYYIQYNGFTTPLTATIQVVPCSTYRMKLAIADAGDGFVDSGVFLAEGGLFCQTTNSLAANPDYTLTCSAPNSGKAWTNTTGGAQPYTYTWGTNPPQNTDTAYGLSAGTYSVTIQDNGCSSFETSVTLTSIGPNLSTTQTSVACAGDSTATATVSISGGTAPYTILWSTGSTQNTATGLWAGTHDVTVTDNIGCLGITSVTITASSTLNASVSTNPSGCSPSGSATVNASGGTGPYTYLWSTNAVSQTINNLAAGTYDVTVTDNAGCTLSASGVVGTAGTGGFTVGASATDVSCNGAQDGSVAAVVSGGSTPYTYAWSTAAGNVSSISNLGPGIYTVTVTDNAGCSFAATDTVFEDTPVTVTTSTTAANCQPTGTATATPAGGTGPYTYLWSNAGNTQTISNLAGGIYTVTVTDANGCTVLGTDTVTELSGMQLTLTPTAGNCFNPTSGSITSTVTGGTQPYTYLWSNTATTPNMSNLADGVYILTVTDANGCVIIDSADVYVPEPPSLGFTNTPITCVGDSDATIQILVNGGEAPYTYAWSTGDTTAFIDSLGPGTYSITVTGSNGCTDDGTIIVPPVVVPFVITGFNVVEPNCGATDGSITVNSNAAYPVDTYEWSNGDTTQTITGLGAGTYSVTIYSVRGCIVLGDTTLVSPTPFTIDLTPTNVSCNGANDGRVVATPVGGTGPFSFNWSNSVVSDTNNNLAGGTYIVTITDAAGCEGVDSVTISEPAAIQLSLSATDANCVTSGSATVNATGGTAPVYLLWSTNETTASITGLAGGQYYNVTATDANGCTEVDSIFVTLNGPNGLAVSLAATDATCTGIDDGSIDATVTGGTTPFTYQWNNSATTEDLSMLATGTYIITVTDANGCTVTDTATVAPGTSPTLSVSGTDITCNGGADGTAEVTGSFNSFAWSHNDGNNPTTGLTAGTYIVTVYDANGCEATDSVTLTEPSAIVVNLTATEDDCHPELTGGITTAVSGGTPPYAYLWSDNSTAADLDSVAEGTYTVTVTDDSGCSITATEIVTYDPPLSVDLGPDQTVCFDEEVRFNLSNLIGTFLWNDGSTDPVFVADEGEVSVNVLFNNGCADEDTVLITRIGEGVALDSLADTTICMEDTALLTAGPDSIYSYIWFTGETTPTISVTESGLYRVTAYDQCTQLELESLIQVERCDCELEMPNAFSPNGDGLNDLFMAYKACPNVYAFSLAIYDRWGGKVFQSTDFPGGWDGTSKGKPCNEGVYVWRLSYSLTTNGVSKEQLRSGSVTLLR